MTKEEMADKWIKQNCCECCVNKDDCDAGTIDCFAKQAFLAGYETLKKENAELNDKLNNLASVAKVRLANWQKYADAYNETQELLDKQIEATYKVVEENNELKEKLNKATEILKVVLNKWKEERWILQSEKEVKMIENVMKEAEEWIKNNLHNTEEDYIKAYKDGAEFGYNKALEEQGDKIESAYREGVAFGKGKLIEQMKCCANCAFSEENSRLDETFCHKEGCYVMASGKCKLWEF